MTGSPTEWACPSCGEPVVVLVNECPHVKQNPPRVCLDCCAVAHGRGCTNCNHTGYVTVGRDRWGYPIQRPCLLCATTGKVYEPHE